MRRIIGVSLFALIHLVAVGAQYPTLVVGAGAEPLLAPDASGASLLYWTAVGEGLFSLRTLIGETDYFALFLKARGGAFIAQPLLALDEEILNAEGGFSLGPGRLILKTNWHSSFLGTAVEGIFFTPGWDLKYYFLTETKKVNPYVLYSGYLRLLPESALDYFSEKGEIGFEYRPSVLEEYRLGLNAGWEGWYETPVYDSSGASSGFTRNDFLASLTGKAGGLIDFFFSWDMELSAGLRFSTANAYLPSFSYLNPSSEDAFTASFQPGCEWSPSSAVTLKLKPLASYKLYLSRRALSPAGALLDEQAWIFSAGGTVEFNWTPNDALYFFVKIDGSFDFSNDAALDDWQWQAFAGLKLRLDFAAVEETGD